MSFLSGLGSPFELVTFPLVVVVFCFSLRSISNPILSRSTVIFLRLSLGLSVLVLVAFLAQAFSFVLG